MADDLTLSEHLHKLIGVKSEQKLDNLLQLLWQTRKTGLSNSQKSSIHSLFNLPSLRDLDPILACLRSLIRNYVHKNFEDDDDLKLLPADLPMELQSMLLVLLQKHRRRWKDELSLDSHQSGWTRSSHQVNVGLSAPLLPCSSSAVSGSFLSLQVDPVPHFNSPNIGGPTPTAERNVACFPHFTLQNDVGLTETQGVLPRVKSMTWTVENKGEIPTNRVAIITLKLHDYTKSPLNEMEVKFQLTRDTLEAVLRSMAYISEQLSQFVSLMMDHCAMFLFLLLLSSEYGMPHFLSGQIIFKTITEETEAMMSQFSLSILGIKSTRAPVEAQLKAIYCLHLSWSVAVGLAYAFQCLFVVPD